MESGVPADQGGELVLSIVYEPDDMTLDRAFGLEEDTLVEVVAQTLLRVGIVEPVEVSLLVADDVRLHELNLEYRGHDEATDVLSFPLLDAPLVQAAPDELWQPAEAVAHDDTLDGALDAEAMPGSDDLAPHNGAAPAEMTIAPIHPFDNQDTLTNAEPGAPDDEADDPLEAEADEIDEADTEEPLHLGDIALSREAVVRQAQQAGHSAAWECAYLVAHGVLHLVGYDDQTDAGYQAMVAHQEAILASVGVPR